MRRPARLLLATLLVATALTGPAARSIDAQPAPPAPADDGPPYGICFEPACWGDPCPDECGAIGEPCDNDRCDPCRYLNCDLCYYIPCPPPDCDDLDCPTVCDHGACEQEIAVRDRPPLPCSDGKLCLYAQTLISELERWDPQTDGVPNPTLDCATGPTLPWIDTDGDGRLDPVDEDDDCDHISDALEAELGMERLNSDSDDDGVVDRRDLTPTTNVPVSAVVRAVEFALLNWDSGPSDAFAPDDPFLRDDAGITNDDGDPTGTELLSVGMMTKTDHLHQNKVYDYTTETKRSRDDIVEFSQDFSDYALKPCLDCYPKLEFHFPIHDHDLECFPVGCAPGHPDEHESDAENERYVYKRLDWTLLRLSAASGEAMNSGQLRDADLDGRLYSVTHKSGGGWAIEFTIKRATNTSRCGVINALLGSLEGSGSDDYVTVTEFRNEENETGYDCSKV